MQHLFHIKPGPERSSSLPENA